MFAYKSKLGINSIFVLALITSLVKANYTKTDFIQQLLRTSFDSKYVLYYLRNDCGLSEFMDNEIYKSKIPVMRIDPDNWPWIIDRWYYKDGYIIVTDKFDYLVDLFQFRVAKNTFWFQTKKRILIFYDGAYRNFSRYPFDFAVGLMGLDIIVVQGFEVRPIKTDFKISTRQNITVVSMQTKNQLGYYYDIKDYATVDDGMVKYDWVPNFELYKNRSTYRVIAFDCHPYVSVDKGRFIGGIEFQMIQEIMKKYPVEFIHPLKSFYGELTTAIANGSADISLCGIWREANYLDIVDVSINYESACVACLVRKPQLLPDYLILFKPFQTTVWLCIITQVLTTGFTIFLKHLQHPNTTKSFIYYLMEALSIYLYNNMVNYFKMSDMFLKCLVTVSYFIALLLTTAYSAGYTSSLAVPKYEAPINTIQDMLDHGIFYGILEEHARTVFGNMYNPIISKFARERFVFKTSKEEDWAGTETERYCKLVEKLRYNYISDTTFLNEFRQNNLRIAKECIAQFNTVFMIPYNSPFKTIVNDGLNHLIEHGFIDAWYRNMDQKARKISGNLFQNSAHTFDRVTKSLPLSKLAGSFFILSGGYGVSMCLFIGELICFKKRTRAMNIEKYK